MMILADFDYPVKILWFICSQRLLIICLSSLLTMRVPDEGVTSGAGTAYPSGAPEFNSSF